MHEVFKAMKSLDYVSIFQISQSFSALWVLMMFLAGQWLRWLQSNGFQPDQLICVIAVEFCVSHCRSQEWHLAIIDFMLQKKSKVSISRELLRSLK